VRINSNKQFRRFVISWFLLLVGFIVLIGGFFVYKSAEDFLIESFKKNKLAQVSSMSNFIDGSRHQLINSKKALNKVSTKKLLDNISAAATADGLNNSMFTLNYNKSNQELRYALHSEAAYSEKHINEVFESSDQVKHQFIQILAQKNGTNSNLLLENGGLYVFSPIKNNKGENVALLVMYVHQFALDKLRQEVLSSMVLNFSLLSIVLMLAAIIFSRKVTGPVELLNQAITRLIQNDFNFKLSTKSFGSFGFLANQFNLMLTRLHLSRTELIKLNKSYSRFVPHQLLKQLSSSGVNDISLGDSCERVMTILFCDIRGFTTLSESMSPSANFKFINRYLSQIAPVINKHGGTIDKYLGDGIMALFPNGADEALMAAIEMIDALEQYNEKLRAKKLPVIEVGIGLHTGKTMLGTVGTSSRMDATVISDSVNAAARVEAMTKAFATRLLITEETKLLLNDLNKYHIRYIASCQIKGKSKPVTMYEVYNNDPASLKKEKSHNRAGMFEAWKVYKSGDSSTAIQLYQRLMEKSPHDKSLFALIERCQSGRL
jgi:class 3 adenylate cyclase